MALFLKTLRTSPAAIARVTVCRGTPAWAVNPAKDRTFVMDVRSSPNGYTFMNGHPELYASPYYPSMHVRPLSGTLHHAAEWWYDLGKTPQLNWIIWNGATWCWLGYLVVLRLAHRLRRREVLAPAAVTLGAQLTVFVATPAPLFRYMATPFFVGVLSLPLLFSRLDRDADPTEPR
jgi:hypothetical protein